MTDKLKLIGAWLPLIIGIAVMIGLPKTVELYSVITATIFASMAILALSLGLVWGYAGILCFGQAAFFGIGGYTYAVSAINFGGSTEAVFIALVVPALFAALLGYFVFYGRISDVYLGVITLTVTLILFKLLNSTAGDQYKIGEAPLGGFNGIPGAPTLNWPGNTGELLSPEQIFYVAIAVLLIAYYGCKALLASHFGRVVVAVRENERRAELIGYDVRFVKLMIFTVGGLIAGAAGIMFASCVFVSPTMFSLAYNAQIIIWVIVGGLGTLIGPIIGCVLVQGLTTYLGTTNSVDPNLVLGIVFVLFVLLVPKGLVPLLRDWGLRRLGSVKKPPSAESKSTSIGGQVL